MCSEAVIAFLTWCCSLLPPVCCYGNCSLEAHTAGISCVRNICVFVYRASLKWLCTFIGRCGWRVSEKVWKVNWCTGQVLYTGSSKSQREITDWDWSQRDVRGGGGNGGESRAIRGRAWACCRFTFRFLLCHFGSAGWSEVLAGRMPGFCLVKEGIYSTEVKQDRNTLWLKSEKFGACL